MSTRAAKRTALPIFVPVAIPVSASEGAVVSVFASVGTSVPVSSLSGTAAPVSDPVPVLIPITDSEVSSVQVLLLGEGGLPFALHCQHTL